MISASRLSRAAMHNSAFNMGIWAGALRFYVSVLEIGRKA